MSDVKNNLCKIISCGTQVKKKYEGYCLRCYIHTYPDRQISRNYKTKEKKVVEYILQQYPNLTWFTDKRIHDGSSLKRPDLLLDLGHQVLIIEVDENKHSSYECENSRMMQLWQDLKKRNVIFIRFNPDSYTIGSRKILSPWGYDDKMLSVVVNEHEWDLRLGELKKEINYWMETFSEDPITKTYLFFDN